MTDRTPPEAGSTHIIRYALEMGLLWIDGSARDKVREALDALDTLEAQLEAIGAGGVSALMGAAKAGSDGVASLPLPGAQEAVAPHGWLYDWTHSSATGRPDETYTGFTKDEQHARKHDNCTPVYTAPQPALSAGWVSVDERLPEPNAEVLCAGRGWGNSFVTACYYDDERREWYPINTHWTDATGCAQYPTHWQPLPASPTIEGESK